MELEITDSARDKIQGFLEKEQAEDKPLRLSVVRTHCMAGRGHGYDLRVADGAAEGDSVMTANGLSVIVDSASAQLLGNVEVDFVEGFEENGFRVTNSKATAKCPCGHHDLFA